MNHMYIPTGIKKTLVRFIVNCNQKRQIVRFHGGLVTILVDKQFVISCLIKDITLGASEEIMRLLEEQVTV